MSTLGMLINDLQRFFASASKIVELYYARSTIVTRQDAVKKEGRVQGAVKFDHVTLKRNGTEVLHDINLDIKPGETIAIMGPTGCGKTYVLSASSRAFRMYPAVPSPWTARLSVCMISKSCVALSVSPRRTCSCSPIP